MNAAANWKIDSTMILSQEEIVEVLGDLHRKGRRAVGTRQNLAIFRLATCCGLRVSEIVGLNLADVHVGIGRPYLQVRKAIAKGRKARRVHLWWDGATLADLTAWKAERKGQGAKPTDPFVCTQHADAAGKRLDRFNCRKRFQAACRCLGPARVAELTIHHGRHSFVSHALAGGRSLAEVRDAAGHSSVSITSVYTHVANDDNGRVGDLFAFPKASSG